MKELKKKLFEHLKSNINQELEKSRAAYKSTQDHATSPELLAESKYDTRSIEAGYLAGAQKKRVDELELELKLINEMSIDHPPEKISVGSLVDLKFNEQTRSYFISSTSGGTMVSLDGKTILVISAFSPIGTEAIGLEVGESFVVETANAEREYTIQGIY